MSEKSAVDLVEEWQSGAFLVLFSVLAGAVVAFALRGPLAAGPWVTLAGFVGGAVAGFLGVSYVRYGR
jgi:hypothetical protein